MSLNSSFTVKYFLRVFFSILKVVQLLETNVLKRIIMENLYDESASQ